MKWILDFFNDLGGSLIGGRFYAAAVNYSTGRCWRFLLIFLFIASLIMTFHLINMLSFQYGKVVDLFETNGYKVVFDNGVIANMPSKLKLIAFEGDTLAVWEWIGQWSDTDSLRQAYPNVSLFVGPKGVFSYGGVAPRSMMYPRGLAMTIDAEYLKNMKTGYSWIVWLAAFVIIYIVSIPWAALAIMVFIIPFLAIKFSKTGMRFGVMWRLGMFLASFHFIYFMIVMLLNIDIPYGWILNFPIYIFVVALLVKIEPDMINRVAQGA